MSNQAILWSAMILPWFTLFLMKAAEVKRFLTTAFFGAVLVTVFSEFALGLNWWVIRESIFPFYHMPPLAYGAFPVGILWIFRLTYGRPFFYFVLNAVVDYLLLFHFDNWLAQRGVLQLVALSQLQLFLMDMVNAVILYGCQLWLEAAPAPGGATTELANHPQPALKPLPEKEK